MNLVVDCLHMPKVGLLVLKLHHCHVQHPWWIEWMSWGKTLDCRMKPKLSLWFLFPRMIWIDMLQCILRFGSVIALQVCCFNDYVNHAHLYWNDHVTCIDRNQSPEETIVCNGCPYSQQNYPSRQFDHCTIWTKVGISINLPTGVSSFVFFRSVF